MAVPSRPGGFAAGARSLARAPGERALERQKQVHRALADTTRLRILALLTRGEVCVCHIYHALGVSQPKASRHLAYLRRAGLVATRRLGQWVYYRLAQADPPARSALDAALRCLKDDERICQDHRRLAKLTGNDPYDPGSGQPKIRS